jgi:5'-3' exonuclease
MNTVIKSIIEQASNAQKFTVPKPENKFREGMFARYEVDVDRVAELMIEECIRNLELNGYDDAAESVKQHFGENDDN